MAKKKDILPPMLHHVTPKQMCMCVTFSYLVALQPLFPALRRSCAKYEIIVFYDLESDACHKTTNSTFTNERRQRWKSS